jgi:hypothetical protein
MMPQIKLERWLYAARTTEVLSEQTILKTGAERPSCWQTSGERFEGAIQIDFAASRHCACQRS